MSQKFGKYVKHIRQIVSRT